MDFGLPVGLVGPGDEDPVLEKGFPRFCGELDAMVMCSICKGQHELGRNQNKSGTAAHLGAVIRSGAWGAQKLLKTDKSK